MKARSLTSLAVAAVLAAGLLVQSTGDAEARRWHRGAGWAGLALGLTAAGIIAGTHYYPRHRRHYYSYDYDYPYYGYTYYRPYKWRRHHRHHRHW